MVNNKVILMGRLTKDAKIMDPRERMQVRGQHFHLRWIK